MKTIRHLSLLSLLAGVVIAGCQDQGPAAPELESVALEDQIALDLLADPGSAETVLAMAETQTASAQRHGHAWRQGQDLAIQARQTFQKAEGALAEGNQTRALEQARQARRLLVRSMESAGGPMALDALVEHLASLPLGVESDAGSFDDPGGLGLMLGQLAQRAGEALQKGNRIQAGQLGVLGEQLAAQHRLAGGAGLADRAELSVALGAEAIGLATRLLGEQSTDAEQVDLLATAEAFQSSAEEALEAGAAARAAHFAHLAEWWALKAVVVPGGITDEEVQAMLDLAFSLSEQATEAVGADPDPLQTALLTKVARLLEMGQANMNNGTCRGLGALWQASVISSYVLG